MVDRSGAYPPFPLFVYLENVPVVVVGAGAVASRKIKALIEYGACVTVIAPEACDEVRALAGNGKIALVQRCYENGDLAGARYVVCATDSRAVSERVCEEAQNRNTLVNVVDVPELCNTIVPSVMRRGKLQVAVSTSGAAPSLARNIRKGLEKQYAPHWEDYVDVLSEVRDMIKANVSGSPGMRTPLYEALVGSDLEARYAKGERLSAREVYDAYIVPLLAGGKR